MTPYSTFSSLTDQEWLEVVLRGIQEERFAGIELPQVPPEHVRGRSSGECNAGTSLRSGFKFYQIVKDYMVHYGGNLTENTCILDFGCGWGRVTRFFMKDVPHENLYGIDVDSMVIEACKQTLQNGQYAVSQKSPPSGFPSATFDLIYSYSVFSHLPESLILEWLAEFEKILKPGGVLVATTLNRYFLRTCGRFARETGI